jgi:addiction module RelB/DinJ family antitoxin
MKDAVVRARIALELKSEAVAVLKANDLELSDAIRLFLRQVVRSGGLPFAVRNRSVRVASGKRLWAMKHEAQARDLALVARGDVPVPPESMLLLRPKRLEGSHLRWPDVPLSDDYVPA